MKRLKITSNMDLDPRAIIAVRKVNLYGDKIEVFATGIWCETDFTDFSEVPVSNMLLNTETTNNTSICESREKCPACGLRKCRCKV